MTSNRRTRFCLLAVALCSGCGPGADLAPVTGVVRIDGQPYPDGKVIFNPVADPESIVAGRSAVGRLDAEGRFELGTYRPADGALIGEHTVTLFRAADDSATRPDLARLNFVRVNMPNGNIMVEPAGATFEFDLTSDEIRRTGNRR